MRLIPKAWTKARPKARWMVIGCMLVFCAQAFSQTVAEPSAMTVLRSQVQAVAEAWNARLSLPESSRIGLRVSGAVAKEFTENSILEVLQRRGYKVALSSEQVDWLLDVLVHEQDVSYEELSDKRWKRVVSVSMEARLSMRANQEVRYLGKLDVSAVDTVTQREEGWWSSREGEPGTFEKIVTPIVVLAASAVMVYLFFTVRN